MGTDIPTYKDSGNVLQKDSPPKSLAKFKPEPKPVNNN